MTSTPHSFTALIFDLDGTLIDSAPDIAAAVNHYLVPRGWPAQETTYVERFIGHGPRRLLQDMFTDLKLPTTVASIDAAHVAFMEHYWQSPTRLTQFYPNVAADLHSLHAAGIALGLCTNKPQALTLRILDQLAIAHLFRTVVGADAVPVCKPNPGHLLAVADKMGLQHGTWAYVGDSGIDQATALAAAVPFFVVPWGGGARVNVADCYRLTRLRDLL
jgi:phosphoglycolate phosphatase